MTDRRTTAVLALAVALAPAFGLLAPAFGFGVVAPASADAGATTPTRISDCTTIAEPGEYVLARDVTNATPNAPRTGLGACIAVRADDVTLRGDGHAVAAGGTGGQPGVVGVLVGGREPRSNVTVRNLTTTRWGGGVAALGVSGATFRNVSAVDNLGDGFFAERSPGLEVRGGTISGSNTGLFVRNAPGARLADLTVTGNLAGVSVRQSDDATLRNLSVADHSQFGVGLFRSANATLANSTLRDDGFAEVALARSSDARLVGVSVADAPGWAVYAVRNSTAVGQRVRIGEAGLAPSLSFEVRDAALDSAADAPPLPITDRQVVGDPLLALPTGADARLSLSVGYDDAAVERARTTEDSLSLWRFDAGEGWRRVSTTVDADADTATAEFGNLTRNGTVVALVGEGFAERDGGYCAPASRYSCWTATTSDESSQSA